MKLISKEAEERIKEEFKDCMKKALDLAENKKQYFSLTAACKREAILRFIYENGSMVSWWDIAEWWENDLKQDRSHLNHHIVELVNAGYLHKPGKRGFYTLTLEGARLLGVEHPFEKLKRAREEVSDAARICEAVNLDKAVLDLDEVIGIARALWGVKE